MYKRVIETYKCIKYDDNFQICDVKSNGVEGKFKVYNKDKVISDDFRKGVWWEKWLHTALH